MPHVTLRVRNFHGLRSLDWSPEGLCLLVGPNGAGKTTALAALSFLRTALSHGVMEAIRFAGGAGGLRNLGAALNADVVFELEMDEITWRLEIPIEGEGVHPYHGERLLHRGECLLDVPRLKATYLLDNHTRQRGTRAELDTLVTIRQEPRLRDFCERVRWMLTYDELKFNGSALPDDLQSTFLSPAATNLIPVLQSWRAAPRQFRGQFDWVVGHLRSAFPEIIEDLEFSPPGTLTFYPANSPHPDAKLPLHLAADGVVQGLLVLTAVAGAARGALIAFDEVERHLHPHAIRRVIHAMRERIEERDLTVVLTTHSPVVLNQLRGEPERVFVLNHGQPEHPNPAPMSELHSEAWLAQSKLGTLYEGLAFGGPPGLGGR